MCSNVLPSAPHDESSLYPQLSPHDFRMQKTMKFQMLLTQKSSIIEALPKNINALKMSLTGARPAPP